MRKLRNKLDRPQYRARDEMREKQNISEHHRYRFRRRELTPIHIYDVSRERESDERNAEWKRQIQQVSGDAHEQSQDIAIEKVGIFQYHQRNEKDGDDDRDTPTPRFLARRLLHPCRPAIGNAYEKMRQPEIFEFPESIEDAAADNDE